MPLILCIETSTQSCSVALEKDGEVLSIKESAEGLNHSVLTAPFTDSLLRENGIEAGELDAVAVSMGPGSYTGLRIGVSMAKGICYGVGIPLLAIPTLMALAVQVSEKYCTHGDILVPMIDARRMEVYSAVFDAECNEIAPVEAIVIDEHFREEFLKASRVLFFGNGSAKAKNVLRSPNAVFIDGIEASASSFASIAEKRFRSGKFENTAYFEPYYLKNFIATRPKKVL